MENYITNEGRCQEENQKKREALHELDAGAVRYEWDEDPVRFYAVHEGRDLMNDLPEGAELNPYIALTRFLAGISDELRPKIKGWLRARGYNVVTGCRINMDCKACQAAGLSGPAVGCPRIK